MDAIRQDNRKMPLTVKIVLGVVAWQVVANLVLGGMLLYSASEDVEHGIEVLPLQYVLGYGSLVVAVVVVGCAVSLAKRAAWARPTLTVFEGITVLSGLVSLVQGAPQGVVGIVLAVLVIVHLFRVEVTDWLETADRRTGHE